VRPVKHRSRSAPGQRSEGLPIQALYSVSKLARAMGVSHHRAQTLLKSADVCVMRAGRSLYVPLIELEEKVPRLWESIKSAESSRRAFNGC
jgi:hypothetical protein